MWISILLLFLTFLIITYWSKWIKYELIVCIYFILTNANILYMTKNQFNVLQILTTKLRSFEYHGVPKNRLQLAILNASKDKFLNMVKREYFNITRNLLSVLFSVGCVMFCHSKCARQQQMWLLAPECKCLYSEFWDVRNVRCT